jgi:hypothetical protein
MEPGVKAAVNDALRVFEDLGCEVDREVSLPSTSMPRRLLHHRPERGVREPGPL